MAVVWRLYGGTPAELAVCSAVELAVCSMRACSAAELTAADLPCGDATRDNQVLWVRVQVLLALA